MLSRSKIRFLTLMLAFYLAHDKRRPPGKRRTRAVFGANLPLLSSPVGSRAHFIRQGRRHLASNARVNVSK